MFEDKGGSCAAQQKLHRHFLVFQTGQTGRTRVRAIVRAVGASKLNKEAVQRILDVWGRAVELSHATLNPVQVRKLVKFV